MRAVGLLPTFRSEISIRLPSRLSTSRIRLYIISFENCRWILRHYVYVVNLCEWTIQVSSRNNKFSSRIIHFSQIAINIIANNIVQSTGSLETSKSLSKKVRRSRRYLLYGDDRFLVDRCPGLQKDPLWAERTSEKRFPSGKWSSKCCKFIPI
jgi:hypothetical protein